MSVPVLLAVGVLGGAGAVARLVLDAHVAGRLGRAFPYGTFAVNLLGSFGLGLVAGAAVDGVAYRLVATGFIAAFTTFSTWTFESHRLGEDGRAGLGALNLAVSLGAGLVAVWIGRHLGGAL